MPVSEVELMRLAIDAAQRAGSLLLDRFRRPATGVASKSTPTDLVSDADRESESLIIGLISDARPGDGFLGEEGRSGESQSGLRWIVDPLDGTVNFLFGIPTWSVSIAVEDGEGAVVGVVHDPVHEETFSATRNGGAWLNGRRVHVGDKTDLSQALVGTGFAYDERIRNHQAEIVRRLLPRVRDIRRLGSAALDLCMLASGRYDAFYEAYMGPWDRAAGVLIAREAGATVTDLAPPLGDGMGVVAAIPSLHDELRKLVG